MNIKKNFKQFCENCQSCNFFAVWFRMLLFSKWCGYTTNFRIKKKQFWKIPPPKNP